MNRRAAAPAPFRTRDTSISSDNSRFPLPKSSDIAPDPAPYASQPPKLTPYMHRIHLLQSSIIIIRLSDASPRIVGWSSCPALNNPIPTVTFPEGSNPVIRTGIRKRFSFEYCSAYPRLLSLWFLMRDNPFRIHLRSTNSCKYSTAPELSETVCSATKSHHRKTAHWVSRTSH